MNAAAIIAATGFFSVCMGLTYYLFMRPHTERMGDLEWETRDVECPICMTINEIVAPPMLTAIDCGHCGRPIEIDADS